MHAGMYDQEKHVQPLRLHLMDLKKTDMKVYKALGE
jgi:hypothetical protein